MSEEILKVHQQTPEVEQSAFKAIQQPWLGIGSSTTPHLVVLIVIGIVTTIAWVTLANRVAAR